MLILDTDLLTLVQRKEGDVYARLDARLEVAGLTEKICVTIISFEEQLRGWLAYIARAKSLEKQVEAYGHLHELFDDFNIRTILDYDRPAAEQFEQLVRAKIRIGTMDRKIAAIALANSATLLSRNLSDYRKVPGLLVEDWTLP
jgi:tRNA(fMet)-specific endonuclease VapC